MTPKKHHYITYVHNCPVCGSERREKVRKDGDTPLAEDQRTVWITEYDYCNER